MAALNDVLGFAFDADGSIYFQVREGSRLAAIVQSLFPPAREEYSDAHQVKWGYWSALANCDPVSAAYVIEQLASATKDDIAARLAVVGMDEFALGLVSTSPNAIDLLAPIPEAPHAP